MDFKIFFSKIYFWFKKNDNIIYLEYAALAFFILAPLFKPGFVFALDMIFTPKIPMPSEIGSSYLLGSSLHFLNYIIPSQIIQKILFFLVIFLAGVGMHRLVPTKNQWPKYFAGLFYIFNPFVYSRFLYGHLFLLLAYALLPWIIKDLFKFFKETNLKNTFRISLWFILISLINIHSIFFIFLFFAIFLLFYIWKNIRNKKQIFKICKYSILAGLIFFVLSSWWIVPFFANKSPTSQFITEQITDRHAYVFQTTAGEKYGTILNTAAMYGFWGDQERRYVVQKDINPYWFKLYLIILAIAVWGAISNFSKKIKNKIALENKNKNNQRELYILPMVTIGIISLVLAVGIAYKPFVPLIEFLNNHIPFYKGYREPQKWVALIILVYAYLGSLGMNDLIPRFQRFIKNSKLKVYPDLFKKFIPALFLIIPLLYSPAMVWGFRGQLHTSDYPQSWYEANKILNQDEGEFKVLFFPWHQYLHLSFAGKVIGNPSQNFFDKKVIAGDNMEMGNIYTQSNRPESKYIEQEILWHKNEIKNLGEKLLLLNIKYVILAQEADFFNYDFVNHQNDLELIYEKERIKIYKNKSWDSR